MNDPLNTTLAAGDEAKQRPWLGGIGEARNGMRLASGALFGLSTAFEAAVKIVLRGDYRGPAYIKPLGPLSPTNTRDTNDFSI